jgi:hypothetical protein
VCYACRQSAWVMVMASAGSLSTSSRAREGSEQANIQRVGVKPRLHFCWREKQDGYALGQWRGTVSGVSGQGAQQAVASWDCSCMKILIARSIVFHVRESTPRPSPRPVQTPVVLYCDLAGVCGSLVTSLRQTLAPAFVFIANEYCFITKGCCEGLPLHIH